MTQYDPLVRVAKMHFMNACTSADSAEALRMIRELPVHDLHMSYIDNKGNTAFLLAVSHKHKDIVHALLDLEEESRRDTWLSEPIDLRFDHVNTERRI